MLNNLSKVKYVGWHHDSISQLKFSSAPQPYPLTIFREVQENRGKVSESCLELAAGIKVISKVNLTLKNSTLSKYNNKTCGCRICGTHTQIPK